MKRLLILDYFRGPDSTGFAALRNNGDVKIAKTPGSPIDLFDSKAFAEALNAHNSQIFMGHNRLATKGGINHANAHPYVFGDIVGCHNGTLTPGSWAALETLIGEKYAVDSMAIIAGIAKLGIEAVVPFLDGAWALVWFNTTEKTLNFLRNKERPFWYSYSKAMDKIFWASEWEMIDSAMKLSPQPSEFYTDPEKGYKFWGTEIDKLYRIPLPDLIKGSANPPNFIVKELKGKEPAAAYHQHGTYPFHGPASKKDTTSSSANGKTTTSLIGVTDDNVFVLHLKGTKAEPYGGFLSLMDFDKMASFGCSWCQADVEYDDPGVKIIQQLGAVLCPECAQAQGDNVVNKIYVHPEVLKIAAKTYGLPK